METFVFEGTFPNKEVLISMSTTLNAYIVLLPLDGRKFQGPEIAHNQRPLKKAAKIHETSLA